MQSARFDHFSITNCIGKGKGSVRIRWGGRNGERDSNRGEAHLIWTMSSFKKNRGKNFKKRGGVADGCWEIGLERYK